MAFLSLLVLPAILAASGTRIDRPPIPVVFNSVLQLRVSVEGSVDANDLMILDTGSRLSWILHYRLVDELPHHNGGGYGVTHLGTVIDIPKGGRNIRYVDNDSFESRVWTRKKFSLGSHSWMQSFGIVERARVRAMLPMVTGLIGASRDSEFALLHRVFGFKPYSKKEMGLQIAHTDAREECFGGFFTFFSLIGTGPFRSHWTIQEGIEFGKMQLTGHIILDTGASVIAMPQTVFKIFTDQLKSLGIEFNYLPGRMLGSINCSDVEKLPDWVLRKEGENGIRITKQMYVHRSRDGHCALLVSEVKDSLPIIIGTPLLGHVVSEFDSEKQHVGLCHPKTSSLILNNTGIEAGFRDDIVTTTLPPKKFQNIPDRPVSASSAQGFHLATLLLLGFLCIH